MNACFEKHREKEGSPDLLTGFMGRPAGRNEILCQKNVFHKRFPQFCTFVNDVRQSFVKKEVRV
jgi:hypothetical protein